MNVTLGWVTDMLPSQQHFFVALKQSSGNKKYKIE